MENNCLGPPVLKLLRIQKTINDIVFILLCMFNLVFIYSVNRQCQALADNIFYFFWLPILQLTSAT